MHYIGPLTSARQPAVWSPARTPVRASATSSRGRRLVPDRAGQPTVPQALVRPQYTFDLMGSYRLCREKVRAEIVATGDDGTGWGAHHGLYALLAAKRLAGEEK